VIVNKPPREEEREGGREREGRAEMSNVVAKASN